MTGTTSSWSTLSGDWNTTANWNNAIPSSTVSACVINGTSGSPASATISTTGAVGSLQVGAYNSLNLNSGSTLTVSGNQIILGGSLSVQSSTLYFQNNLTISGAGTLNLSGGSVYSTIFSSKPTLQNQSTIQGAGFIGSPNDNLNNSGTINANQSGGNLDLSANATTNTGTLQATAGTLNLGGGNYNNTGGTILATGSGSLVTINPGSGITGATLTTSNGGQIMVDAGTLDGVTISNGSTVSTYVGAATTLAGTITNNGTLSTGDLAISGSTALNGSGTLLLNGNISGATGSDSLSNGANHTIQGGGSLGQFGKAFTLSNQGTIEATAGTLYVSNNTVTNTGVMGASVSEFSNSNSKLVLSGQAINNTGGIIQATGLTNIDPSFQYHGIVDLTDSQITGGTFTTANGGMIVESAPGGVLNGITVSSGSAISFNHAATELQGTITNNGSLVIQSSDLMTEGTTLTGSGTLSLDSSSRLSNQLFAPLVNDVQHTIQGAGTIEGSLTNKGTINANQNGGTLTLNLAGGANSGLIETTNGSTVFFFNSSTMDNTGGTIQASGANSTMTFAGTITNGTLTATNGGTITFQGFSNGTSISATGANSAINLYGGTITGGTLTASSGSTITSTADPTLNGVTIANGTTVSAAHGSVTTLQGTITNNGTLSINGQSVPFGNGNADVVISGGVTLTGSGSLTLTSSLDSIYGATGSDSLYNDANHTIQGVGQIGIGGAAFSLTNLGTINANQSGGTLTVSGSSAAVTNSGVLEATGGGILQLTGAILNYNTILVGNGSTLNLSNATIDSIIGAPIQLNSTGSNTDLQISGSVLLSGPAVVTLSNNSHNRIYGSGSDQFTNGSSTIQGAGQIGISGGGFYLTNGGTIDANQNGGTLQVATSQPITNFGLLEATASGTLGLANNTIDNSGGTILADGANSKVDISGASITGGTLITSNGGTITQNGSGSLTGVAIGSGSTVTLGDGSTTTLGGTITNNGTLLLNGQTAATNLVLAGNVTLTGSGSLTLTNATFASISAGGSDTLLNDTSHTIQGAGNIGTGAATGFTLTNQGTIDANQNGHVLQINTGHTVTNTGFMEATNGGTLLLSGNVNINNASGVIEALGNGSTVNLGATQIAGGTLTTANGGAMTLSGGALNGVTLSAGSTVSTNGPAGTLAGTIVNNGTLAVGSRLALSGNVDLTGSGSLSMSTVGSISGSGSNTLLNDTNHTIQGAGQIGVSGGGLTLTNQGTVNANQSGATLTIATGHTVINNALMEATGGGTLAVSDAVNNTGTLQAGYGSTLSFGGNVNNTGILQANDGGNLSFNNLTVINNGTLALNSAGHNTTLQFTGTVTLTGNPLTLSDSPGNNIYGSSASDKLIISSGYTIQGAGEITRGGTPFTVINNGTIFANGTNELEVAPGTFTNNGTLEVASGSTMVLAGITNFNNGTLTGGTYDVEDGVLRFGAISSGGISDNAATIVLNGTQASISNGFGVNALFGFSVNEGSGSFTMENGRSLIENIQLFSNSGDFTVGVGSEFSVDLGSRPFDQILGVTRDDGTITASVMDVSGGMFEGTGALDGGLTVAGGTVKPGDSPGTLTVTGNYTQQSNGTLQIDILGSQVSALDIQGTAQIGGTLDLNFLGGGFVDGETLTVLQGYSSLSGAFDQIDITGLDTQGWRAQIVYGSNQVSVQVFSPEPGTWGLAGIALLAFALRRYGHASRSGR